MAIRIGIISFSLLVLLPSFSLSAEETQVPYLEAVSLDQKTPVQAADIQRQVVLLNAQARLTPDWTACYRQLLDVYLQIGRADRARVVDQKYMSHQNTSAFAQSQLIRIELQQYQTAESRRKYLEQILNRPNLLPEVIGDIYRELAQISWENFEADRAKKYLEMAIKRWPMDVKAFRMLRTIVESDKAAGPIDTMQAQVRELQAMLMANPLNAVAALQLAALAGEADRPDLMLKWQDQAEALRKTFAPGQRWPAALTLGLAEAYLASGRARQAVDLLRSVSLAASDSDNASSALGEIRTRITLLIAARKAGLPVVVEENRQWLDRYMLRPDIPKPTADDDTLISLYYSLYADRDAKNSLYSAVTNARSAVKLAPDNPGAKIALALALARTGDDKAAAQLVKEIDRPRNPLVLLTKYFLETNAHHGYQARKLLDEVLASTPYGMLRDAVPTITGLSAKPPAPNLADVQKTLDQFDGAYRHVADDHLKACTLMLVARGKPAQEPGTMLVVTAANAAKVPLAVGSGSFISPECTLEIQPVPADGRRFYISVPLDARQILAPGKAESQTAPLAQAASPNPNLTWDYFIANHLHSVRQVTIQAKLYTTVGMPEPVESVLAESRAVTVELPAVDTGAASSVIAVSPEALEAEPWRWARLARWCLLSQSLKDQHGDITRVMIEQVKNAAAPGPQAAMAWALRSARPEPPVFNALAQSLSSKDWLTRLTALDSLGQLQGPAARPLFEHFAANDPDDLVRQLSAGYLLYRYEK